MPVTVSDFTALARREKLAEMVDNHYTPGSVYIPAVGCVNQVLQHLGIGISERAFNSISDNIRQVHFGTKSEMASSLRESMVFAQDTVDGLKEGRFNNALASASGSAINAVGSTLYFANYDRERLPAYAKALFDMEHP